MLVELSEGELELVVEALDSHVYWQLSDEHYRDSGYVDDPGSDDVDTQTQIVRARKLEDRLTARLTSPPASLG